jgi:hypothetical protein
MYSQYKKKKIVLKLDKIDEDKIFIEKNINNKYNQKNIIKKIYEIYLDVITKIFN